MLNEIVQMTCVAGFLCFLLYLTYDAWVQNTK